MPRILGIDYGRKRIGLALSDPAGTFAQPFRVVTVRDRAAGLRAIVDVCREQEVVRVVVGVPLDADGQAGPMAEEVFRWCADLAKVLPLPIDQRDERLSSAWAERVSHQLGWSSRRMRRESDALAAQAILDDYLVSLRSKGMEAQS